MTHTVWQRRHPVLHIFAVLALAFYLSIVGILTVRLKNSIQKGLDSHRILLNYFINFSPIVRRTLIAIAVILFASAIYLLVSSLILMTALRKEHEIKFKHWLRAMGLFIIWRTLTIIFQSIVNVRNYLLFNTSTNLCHYLIDRKCSAIVISNIF